eukprot:1583219-Prymnesium_polylepis.2
MCSARCAYLTVAPVPPLDTLTRAMTPPRVALVHSLRPRRSACLASSRGQRRPLSSSTVSWPRRLLTARMMVTVRWRRRHRTPRASRRAASRCAVAMSPSLPPGASLIHRST